MILCYKVPSRRSFPGMNMINLGRSSPLKLALSAAQPLIAVHSLKALINEVGPNHDMLITEHEKRRKCRAQKPASPVTPTEPD